MRDPHCLYCNELVVRHRGWKHEKIEEYTYDTAIGRVCKKELKSLLEDEE